MDRIRGHFAEAAGLLERVMGDARFLEAIQHAGQVMVKSLRNGGKIMSCGNGGSMCDAMHFAEELTGRFRDDRAPIAAVSISDPSHLTCVANDHGFEQVFARFVLAHGKPGDVLLAISTSGNSPNVLRATEAAKERGVIVVALTGKDGGQLAATSDIEVRVPHHGYADRTQEIHIKVIHSLIDHIEQSS
ncbi:MAG: D-sedoheptulose 7-phosphate isomerase [Flavobacteriales bacterium]|nr:D-sedoheptulose 7-phosphate isomerase [Flavobacteriales bacterium]